MLSKIKKFVPWHSRILAKMILSRLPFGYRLWTRIGVFQHGAMESPDYAWGVVQKHANEIKGKTGWTGLELGPGDTITSAVIAPAFGARGLTLVDAGAFAVDTPSHYAKQVTALQRTHPDAALPDLAECPDLAAVLDRVGGAYHTEGLRSIRTLQDGSMDLIFSQAVLEHVRRDEMPDLARAFRRLIRPDGKMSHVIDFKDHLGGKWNNMRISSKLWEKDWFAQDSGFYTNRLPLSEMIRIFTEAGFDVEVRSTTPRDSAPDARHKLAAEFQSLSDDDLMTADAHLVMTPA